MHLPLMPVNLLLGGKPDATLLGDKKVIPPEGLQFLFPFLGMLLGLKLVLIPWCEAAPDVELVLDPGQSYILACLEVVEAVDLPYDCKIFFICRPHIRSLTALSTFSILTYSHFTM